MITTGTGLFIGTPTKENYFLQFIKFMRQLPPNGPGWLVAGSCNNVTGTMGLDVINNVSDIVTGTWVVLESPDRMTQLLFHVYSGTSHRVYYNPNSDYYGGGVGAIPTTQSAGYLVTEGNIIGSVGECGLHITAEETFPYNFAVCCCPYNTSSIVGSMLFCRFETKNYLAGDHIITINHNCFDRYSLTNEIGSLTPPNSVNKAIYDGNMVTCPWTNIYYSTGTSTATYPEGCGYSTPNGQETFIPSLFINGEFKVMIGRSNFIRWLPNYRTGINLYGNRSSISFGSVAFPWDGFSVPVLDPKTIL